MSETPTITRELILVADDDERLRPRLARALEKRGFDCAEAESGERALEVAAARAPDYAVVDLRMPGMSGLELVKALKAGYPDCIIVVLTGYGSIATAVDAVKLGATHYLPKPADADDILAAFERAELPPDTAPDFEHEVPSLARAEWEHINRVLADCDGNISKAARLLGVHRRSLQRKLAKYPTSR